MADIPNPILLYHPDAYRVDRDDLKGRHSAGEGFLAAFLAQTPAPDVYALCSSSHFAEFAATVAGSGRDLKPRQVSRGDTAVLRERSLVNLPHPELAREARARSFVRDDLYALTGVTHTIATLLILDDVAGFAVAPVMPWDALICTSRAVHAALSIVLDNAEQDLRARIGATRFTRPLMPVIPLGIHAARFSRSEADRARRRAQLGSTARPSPSCSSGGSACTPRRRRSSWRRRLRWRRTPAATATPSSGPAGSTMISSARRSWRAPR